MHKKHTELAHILKTNNIEQQFWRQNWPTITKPPQYHNTPHTEPTDHTKKEEDSSLS